MVYFNPSSARVTRLNSIPFYAEFKDEDLSRLIQAIEESGLRDWHEVYRGEFERYATGGIGSWSVGILFADGSILRRRGNGMQRNTDWLPRRTEFEILTDFARTLGAEIIERHDLDE